VSNINYLSINENFPVPGRDNDTQVFRDNFDTIKQSLRAAKDELEDLQDPVAGAARLDKDNDFNLKTIQRAFLKNNRESKADLGEVTQTTTIDFENGSYQILRLGAAISLTFLNFPGDAQLIGEPVSLGVGKCLLEIYSTGGNFNLSFNAPSGIVLKKDSSFPETITVNSSVNPIFIEVWRHNQSTIFMRYLGVFS
jgi:hypothetical protein